ncbi:MAG: histidine--tRNA ligase [Planctomycetota bacterium]|jgi:histidyl-tRNA synthetase
MGKTVSAKPPSGMRDFLPDAIARRRHVVGVVQSVYESYGFRPLETPAIENLTTLLGKYGPEGDQLLYRILHRRDKLQRALQKDGVAEAGLSAEGLRFDLTVPLARVMARHRQDLPRVFKRYQIQPVWRADRPGRGRFREFYQCDVDVCGSASITSDVEVGEAVSEALERLGFEDFAVHLNHRELLRGLIRAAGIAPALEETALVALDKLDKVGIDGVLKELAGRGVGEAEGRRLLALVGADRAAGDDSGSAEAGNVERLGRLEPELDERGRAAIAELRELLALAEGGPLGRHVRFSPELARGLGYYTGPIFEITVKDLQGSLGGGGRYDGLIGMFSGSDIPAVGFSLGLERLLVVMEERGMLPAAHSGLDVFVTGFPDTPTAKLLELARGLRAAGQRASVSPEPTKKLGKQLKLATDLGAARAAIVGSDELARGVYKVKDLATGEQSEHAWPS